jgi:hypothetical protein
MRSSITRCYVRFVLALALVLALVPAVARAQTPEETWLTDAEGRTYRLEKLPKSQGQKIDDGHIRTMWGVPADLAREDDEFFYIKLYKVSKVAPPPAPPARKAAPPEAVAPTSQRLRWTAYSDGLPTGGQWREGLALADMAKSGHLAIIVSPARKTLRAPVVFVHGDAGWARSPAIKFPSRAYDYGDVAVGDVNGDGVPDVVMGVHLRGLLALQSKAGASGEFEDASNGLPFQQRADTPVFSSQAVVLGDCNGDGKPDIVALGEGPRLPTATKADYAVATGIASFVREADGSWSRKNEAPNASLFGSGMAAGDVDGDGKLDLVIAPGTLGDDKIVFRGDGACGWQAESVDAVRPRSYITSVATAKLPATAKPGASVGDAVILGYTDFGADEPFFGIDLLTRNSDGHWTRIALTREPGRGRIEALATGDLDGDGKPDIAAVDGEGTVTVLIVDGKGRFTREQQPLTNTAHCGGAGIAIGDLDGDGLGDLVVSFASEASPMNPGVCPNEGALMAWKTAKAAGGPGATKSAAPKGASQRGTKH